MLILFLFQFAEEYHIKKTGLLLSFSLLLLLCIFLNFIEVHPGLSIGVIFLFGAAGAGGLQFLCLNKTERSLGGGFFLYFLSNVGLGLLLKKEGETFPKITLLFLVTVFFFSGFFFLVGKVKEESLSSVIDGSKTLLRGVFFPILYLLDGLFLNGAYFLWVSSFVIHVLILLLFKFIFKNEEKDPLLENEEKG